MSAMRVCMYLLPLEHFPEYFEAICVSGLVEGRRSPPLRANLFPALQVGGFVCWDVTIALGVGKRGRGEGQRQKERERGREGGNKRKRGRGDQLQFPFFYAL